MDSITLKHAGSVAVISPTGGYLRSWKVKERDVFYSDPERRDRATHPCGPNFGILSRVGNERDNEYSVGRLIYELPEHGFLKTSLWEVREQLPDRVELVLNNTPEMIDRNNYKRYPFFFEFKLAYHLIGADQMSFDLSFTNLTNDRKVPVDLGIMNYFRFTAGMRLIGLTGLSYHDETTWDRQRVMTLKNPQLNNLSKRDWNFAIGDDNALPRPNREFRRMHIRYPGGMDIRLDPCRFVGNIAVRSDPEEGAFLCVAPVGRGRNALNDGFAFPVNPFNSIHLRFMLTVDFRED